jgi:DNA-binding MurR/RpiR family transcriptional regulator
MPAPLDPKIRAAILADIQGENPQRNEIARKHHVSPSTVTKIAREES